MKTTHRPSQSPRLSKRAVAILRKVQAAILAEPHLYSQHDPYRPACGSPGCICGWIDVFLRPRAKHLEDAPTESLLGGLKRFDRLYWLCDWPRYYQDRFKNAQSPTERASVGARRIDHFIKTGGAE